MIKRLFIALAALMLLAGACGDDDDAAPDSSSIDADDQTGDGFVVIHSDGGGSPGPVIGHSGLLKAGTSTNVVITLDTALTADATVFPMAHLDMNTNGEYEFAPPDVAIDLPATTADGAVAVLGIGYTIG